MGKRVFDLPGSIMVKHFFMSSFKHLAIALRMRGVHKDVSTFFLGIVKETVEYREKHNIKRNDFMDLLIQLKNHGTLDGADVGKLSMNEIAAQVQPIQSCNLIEKIILIYFVEKGVRIFYRWLRNGLNDVVVYFV